jgi:hypothetical protein
VTWGTGVGWGAVLGVGEGLGVGLGLAVAIVALGEGELAAVGAAAPQAVTNTAKAARPFSLVTQEA